MKIRQIILAAVILITTFSVFELAFAAEIECSGNYANASTDAHFWKERYPSGRRPQESTCMAILIHGDIESGDSDKFFKILHDNNPFVANVYLASSGGSVEEAIKIGKLVRTYMLTTFAPMGFSDNIHNGGYLFGGEEDKICPGVSCHCASSCFLIWSAGAERQGNVIGIHRPSNHTPDFADLPPDKASIIYKQELTEISQYLSDMEVPKKYIDIMTDTSSKNIYWLKLDEAKSLQEKPPSIEELLSASCPILSRDETHKMNEIVGAHQLKEPVSELDEAIYKKLSKIDFESTKCVNTKLANYRDSIN